jgi:hypothetical protein
MASNFKIGIFEDNGSFELKLDGDFDVTSAYEVIYAIKTLPENAETTYVNTTSLKTIEPSGLDIWNGFLNSLNGRSARIVVTGDYAAQLFSKNFRPTSRMSNFIIKELGNFNV